MADTKQQFDRLVRRNAGVTYEELSLLVSRVRQLEEEVASLNGQNKHLRKRKKDAQSRYGEAIRKIKRHEDLIELQKWSIEAKEAHIDVLKEGNEREREQSRSIAEKYHSDVGVNVDQLRNLRDALQWFTDVRYRQLLDPDLPASNDPDFKIEGFAKDYFAQPDIHRDLVSIPSWSTRKADPFLRAEKVHAMLKSIARQIDEALTDQKSPEDQVVELSQKIAAATGQSQQHVYDQLQGIIRR